jgi:protein O-mannosyl-transferase
MAKIRKSRTSHDKEQPVAIEETRGTHRWQILLLLIVVLMAYCNSFDAGLVFDNVPVISEDARIRAVTPENIQHILTGQYWYFNQTSGLYRPLTTFSYLLNYAVLGNEARPAGYHWINLALHETNVLLVYGLGILIFADPILALALAAIWGVHPLLTESVTNIVGRADLLAAFGVLAGLLCYVRAIATEGRRKLAWIAALVAAQAVGLFSKENAAILPGLMLLYDLAWPERTTWRARIPAYAALALPFALFFYLRAGSQPHLLIDLVENPLLGASFLTARLTAIKVLGGFLCLFLWPARLSADYSYNAVPLFGASAWDDAKSILALVVCLAAAVLAIRSRNTLKPLFFFIVFFLIAVSPTSNLIVLVGSIMAERFIYLPSIALAGCAVVALQFLRRTKPVAMQTAVALICLALAARTYARNFDWHDGVTLWTSAVQAYPETARAHNNLGFSLLHVPGRLSDAIIEFQSAVGIRPDYAEAHYNLGNALLQIPNRLPDAIAEFQTALRIRPDYPEAHNNLGNALLQAGRLPEAIAEFQAALKISPDYAEAHNNLGNALLQIPNRLPDAIAEFQAATRIKSDYAEAHNNLGNTLTRVPGRLPQAIAELQTAVSIKPAYAEAHNNLGNALLQIPNRLPDAIGEFQVALRIRPAYAEAHNNLANALLQSGRLPEAIAEYQEATRLQPDLADAHFNLGNALLRIPGRQAEALAEFEIVLRIKPDPEVREIVNRLRSGR